MGPTRAESIRVLRFGTFELDAASGELRRNGSIVRLTPQPFQVLRVLVENAGSVVDRDQIRREVWGDTTVDFDRSLNVCIAQIRTALNDDAESPRFIQTLPKRGYRFLATVEQVGTEPSTVTPDLPAPPPKRRTWMVVVAALILAIILGVASYRLTIPAPLDTRIAVLPFDVIGGTPESPQIEGLFDELLTRLSGIQPDRLQVIGRRSAGSFRNQQTTLKEIGERLNVAYIVESTVKTDGPKLRVTSRVSRAATENVIWSETFTQDSDAVDFEERFVARVSAAVLSKLFPGTGEQSSRYEGCRTGWESYRTGNLLARRETIADMQKSITFLEAAPCPEAKATLAQTLTRLARIAPQRELWEGARAAARSALESEVQVAVAHRALGNVSLWHDWDWKTAEREFELSLQRNPSDPDTHHDLAWLLVALGRRDDAAAALQRAIALDPLSFYIHMHAGWLFLQAGRFRDSAAQARRALELEPQSAEAFACLARALMYAGDDRGALEAIKGAVSPEAMQSVASLPPREAIRHLLFGAIPAAGTIDPYQRAWRLAWNGSREEALREVEEAFRRRSSMMPMIAVDPGFDSIRKEPRFAKVVREMHLQ